MARQDHKIAPGRPRDNIAAVTSSRNYPDYDGDGTLLWLINPGMAMYHSQQIRKDIAQSNDPRAHLFCEEMTGEIFFPDRMSRRITTLAVLFIFLLLPASSRAEYRITFKGKTVETACYWIEKSKIHLCEGGEPLALSDVSAITEGQFYSLGKEMHQDARRRFWTYMSWLLDNETDLTTEDRAVMEGLKEIDELRASTGKKKELRSLKKKYSDEIDRLIQQVAFIHKAFSGIHTPDRSLVQLSETKILQMITWTQSLQERQVYINTADPTYREYSQEHMKQVGAFQVSFMRTLSKVTGDDSRG